VQSIAEECYAADANPRRCEPSRVLPRNPFLPWLRRDLCCSCGCSCILTSFHHLHKTRTHNPQTQSTLFLSLKLRSPVCSIRCDSLMMLSKVSSRVLITPFSRSLVAARHLSSIGGTYNSAAAAAATAIHQNHAEMNDSPSQVQHALLEAVISCSTEPLSSSRRDSIYQQLKELPSNTCPDKLDFNDDHTMLVIPTCAFQPQEDPSFASFLDRVVGNHQLDDGFWRTFALFYKCPRVVRACNDNDSNDAPENVLWPPK